MAKKKTPKRPAKRKTKSKSLAGTMYPSHAKKNAY